ncbi:MAG: EamA family transporter [Deltaproteobacteria bacterium]|nr:EamA family transporter [Deltaproteobacteria bacterium]
MNNSANTGRYSYPAFAWFQAKHRGRLLVVLAAVLWSLAGVFIKSLALPPVTIAFYRFLFAALFFLGFIKSSEGAWQVPIVYSIVAYVAATGSFVWANKLTTAANAIVLQYTAPIYIYALAPLLFREQISRANFLALCGGMVGVAVIFFGSVGQPDMPGILIALFSGLVFALYIVNLRFLSKISAGLLVCLNNLGGVLLFLPFAVNDLHVAPIQLLALMVMGVVQFGSAYFFFSKGVEAVSLQEASLILLLEPVLNPLWVHLVTGEVPTAETSVGGSVILLSLALRYVLGRDKKTEPVCA